MAARLTLDLAEPQVLIDFPDDAAGLRWHHRLLLIQTPTPGVWIASTPDYSVQRLDLNVHRVVALARNGPFPAAQWHESYVFDNPIPAVDLARIRQQAGSLALVLGQVGPAPAAPPGAAGVWRVADPSHRAFGDDIPTQDYLCGLVMIGGCWTFCQLVVDSDKDAWERALISDHRKDARVAGDTRDPLTGQRLSSFVDSLALQYAASDPPFPLGGQRVAHEYMRTLRATGLERVAHHLDFVHKSGISPNSNITRAHRRLTDALHAFQQQDMLNLPSLVGIEVLVRYLVQIGMAVARNPRSPDFQDLDAVVASTVNEYVGLVLPEYTKYIAQIQKDEAFTLKQQRQWCEEQISRARGRGSATPTGALPPGTSRGVRRRCNRAIMALNDLGAPLAAARRLASALPANAAQASVLQRVHQRVAAFGEPLGEDGDDALHSILKSKDIYSARPTPVRPYEAHRLKILDSGTRPLPIRSLAPGSLLPLIDHPERYIYRLQAVLDAMTETGELAPVYPFWDVNLRREPKLRLDLFKKLIRIGLVGVRARCRARASIFFVGKKDGSLRMVIDGQEPSAMHRRPPRTELGSAAALSGLCLDADTLVGFDLDSVYDEVSRSYVRVDPDTVVYPCFQGLAMGWSWSLFICNAITEDVTRIGIGQVLSIPADAARVVSERAPCARLGRGELAGASCVDNANGAPIHVLGGRATLLGLRRATRSVAAHGCRVLSIGDNLSSMMAFEKGRCANPVLRQLACQAAARQLATGTQHYRRYSESKRNPTDHDSRAADRFEFAPGQTQRGAARDLGDFISLPPTPQAPPAGPAAAVGTGELPCPPGPPAGQGAGPHLLGGRPRSRAKARCILELYAGCARLTAACLDEGLQAWIPVDISRGSWRDLTDKNVIGVIRSLIVRRDAWRAHLGTPCTPFSQATPARSRAKHLASGGSSVFFTLDILRLRVRFGVTWSVENPSAPRLWKCPEVIAFLERHRYNFVHMHYCHYNCRYLKPTTVVTDLKPLQALEASCSRDHVHEVLEGLVRLGPGKGAAWKTSLAGRYPEALARKWAGILQACAPRAARVDGPRPWLPSGAASSASERASARRGPQRQRVPAASARQALAAAPIGRPRARRPRTTIGEQRAGHNDVARVDFLARRRVKPLTQQHYAKAAAEVRRFAAPHHYLVQAAAQRDKLMVDYLQHIFLAGDGIFAARTALYGYAFARLTLKGFSKAAPGEQRDPCPWGAARLRLSELLSIKSCDVTCLRHSAASGYPQVSITLMPSSPPDAPPSITAKSGEYDDAVIFGGGGPGTAPRRWVARLLRDLKAAAPSTRPLFPFGVREFQLAFRQAADAAGLQRLRLCPHALRHGGASSDFALKARTLASSQLQL
ncbi:unnamed protein product [Prorocentrum cordatum]|uniref:RNA-directed RNA polymerase n=1 Tax=Prorocentrum cordatum TaxID=2364126 RepID=A0ABN9WD18_9DINO|nr:unnamed protein product [Polarella glacialis]